METPAQILTKKLESQTLQSLADESGCAITYLREVSLGNRSPGPKILRFLGLRAIKTVIYKKTSKKNE